MTPCTRRLRALARPASLLAALLLATAAAQADGTPQVYPGCAVPGAPKHKFYIDASNGDPAGDGSKAHPWKSLQALFASIGGASPLLSTVPYRHRSPDGKGAVMSPNPDAPVKPGDAIELMSGDYGDLGARVYGAPIVNSDFVTIEAASGQTPLVSNIFVTGANKLRFKGVKVQSIKSGPKDWRPLVFVGGDGTNGSEDIIFEGLSVSSQEDISGWSQDEWRASGRMGFYVRSKDMAKCVSIVDSKIFNVTVGVALVGNRGLFANNTINNFGDDALDYGANDLMIVHNTITNGNDIGDGNHEDAMQGQIGERPPPGVASNLYSNILIDSNVVLRQTDPNLKFPTYLQGIDAFDSDWHNVTVTNNVIVTTACWGIVYSSLHGGQIINNTVLDDGLRPQHGDCKPVIAVGDKTHEGSSSNDIIVRNNIANGYSIDDRNGNIVVDHNVCTTIKGFCRIFSYAGGKPQWGVVKAGFHGDHNLIDREGSANEFMAFDPPNFVYDLRLRPHAQAIGVGSPDLAPAIDILGAPRRPPIDAGAYAFDPKAVSAK